MADDWDLVFDFSFAGFLPAAVEDDGPAMMFGPIGWWNIVSSADVARLLKLGAVEMDSGF